MGRYEDQAKVLASRTVARSGDSDRTGALGLGIAAVAYAVLEVGEMVGRTASRPTSPSESEYDRQGREQRYLNFHIAAAMMEAEIGESRGPAALSQLRQVAAAATFRAGDRVARTVGEALQAAERWMRVVAANPPGSHAVAEAGAHFAACRAAFSEAIEEDLNTATDAG